MVGVTHPVRIKCGRDENSKTVFGFSLAAVVAEIWSCYWNENKNKNKNENETTKWNRFGWFKAPRPIHYWKQEVSITQRILDGLSWFLACDLVFGSGFEWLENFWYTYSMGVFSVTPFFALIFLTVLEPSDAPAAHSRTTTTKRFWTIKTCILGFSRSLNTMSVVSKPYSQYFRRSCSLASLAHFNSGGF